jgi:hypothetical protein
MALFHELWVRAGVSNTYEFSSADIGGLHEPEAFTELAASISVIRALARFETLGSLKLVRS